MRFLNFLVLVALVLPSGNVFAQRATQQIELTDAPGPLFPDGCTPPSIEPEVLHQITDSKISVKGSSIVDLVQAQGVQLSKCKLGKDGKYTVDAYGVVALLSEPEVDPQTSKIKLSRNYNWDSSPANPELDLPYPTTALKNGKPDKGNQSFQDEPDPVKWLEKLSKKDGSTKKKYFGIHYKFGPQHPGPNWVIASEKARTRKEFRDQDFTQFIGEKKGASNSLHGVAHLGLEMQMKANLEHQYHSASYSSIQRVDTFQGVVNARECKAQDQVVGQLYRALYVLRGSSRVAVRESRFCESLRNSDKAYSGLSDTDRAARGKAAH